MKVQTRLDLMRIAADLAISGQEADVSQKSHKNGGKAILDSFDAAYDHVVARFTEKEHSDQ